jgi:hypothetical protein
MLLYILLMVALGGGSGNVFQALGNIILAIAPTRTRSNGIKIR